MKQTGSVLIHPEELDSVWIDEVVRQGIPRIGLHPVGGEHTDESMAALMKRLETPEFRALLDEAAAKGLEIEYEMHAARYLLPREQFAFHPEWFRMDKDGNRTPDCNFCVTNAEALAFTARRAAQVAGRLYRSTHRFFFWMDDCWDSPCRCPACAQYTPSDQQMIVMNAILAEIRKEIPDAALAYLAYADFKEPPTKVQPAEGIFVEYAPMDRDFDLPMDDPSSEKNARQCGYPAALFRCFPKETSKLLEYWLDNSMYSDFKKPPRPFAPKAAVIRADAAYYKRVGFADLSTFACYLGQDYRELYGMPDIRPFADVLKG